MACKDTGRHTQVLKEFDGFSYQGGWEKRMLIRTEFFWELCVKGKQELLDKGKGRS